MKTCSFAFVLIVLSYCCSAQPSEAPTQLSASYSLDRMSDYRGLNSNELIAGIPLAPGKVVGDTYLSEDWKTGTMLLYEDDKMIERFPIRYDIKTNEIEIKVNNGVKAMDGKKIKSFTWIDGPDRPPVYFINARDLKQENGTSLSGFLEVLEDGAIPLFKQTYLVVKKANYNVSFNVGSPDDKILKKEMFYILHGGKLVEVPGSKKKLLTYFGDQASEVEQFIKDQGIGVTKQLDLQLIFRHYNSLGRK